MSVHPPVGPKWAVLRLDVGPGVEGNRGRWRWGETNCRGRFHTFRSLQRFPSCGLRFRSVGACSSTPRPTVRNLNALSLGRHAHLSSRSSSSNLSTSKLSQSVVEAVREGLGSLHHNLPEELCVGRWGRTRRRLVTVTPGRVRTSGRSRQGGSNTVSSVKRGTTRAGRCRRERRTARLLPRRR